MLNEPLLAFLKAIIVCGLLQVNETNFAPGGSADVAHGKECIQIDGGRQDYSGSWENANCSISQGFICEKTACKLYGIFQTLKKPEKKC